MEAFATAQEQESFVNADLHLNYATALWYAQKYSDALHNFRKALDIEPHFATASSRLESLESFLDGFSESIAKKGEIMRHREAPQIEFRTTTSAKVQGHDPVAFGQRLGTVRGANHRRGQKYNIRKEAPVRTDSRRKQRTCRLLADHRHSAKRRRNPVV